MKKASRHCKKHDILNYKCTMIAICFINQKSRVSSDSRFESIREPVLRYPLLLLHSWQVVNATHCHNPLVPFHGSFDKHNLKQRNNLQTLKHAATEE